VIISHGRIVVEAVVEAQVKKKNGKTAQRREEEESSISFHRKRIRWSW
jgi:hypothetical protein